MATRLSGARRQFSRKPPAHVLAEPLGGVPRHANRGEVRHQRAPDGSGRAADEGTREPEHHQNDRTGHRITHAAPGGAKSPVLLWCEIVALACELLAWTQLLALTGKARCWEPKRLPRSPQSPGRQALAEPGRCRPANFPPVTCTLPALLRDLAPAWFGEKRSRTTSDKY